MRFDGLFQIPSFEEIMDVVVAESLARGRPVGLIPEIKYFTYFASIGLPMEQRLVAALDAMRRCALPVEMQSLETGNLVVLRRLLGVRPDLRLLQLMGADYELPPDVAAAGGALTFGAVRTPDGLAAIAGHVDAFGPDKRSIIPLRPDSWLGMPSSLVRNAHRAGLLVHPYTFRPENMVLAADFRNGAGPAMPNPAGSVHEIRRYLESGVDGFFTDDPALGRCAVDGGEHPSGSQVQAAD